MKPHESNLQMTEQNTGFQNSFKPGDWVQSIYGSVGIVEEHPGCESSDSYVHARYVYGTAGTNAGDKMHVHRHFATKVPVGTEQPAECMDPLFWAAMI